MKNKFDDRIQVNSPEFYFAMSCFFFALIKPILINNASISKVILLVSMSLLLGLSIASLGFKLIKSNFVLVIIIIGTASLLFMFDYVIRPNPLIGDYFYDYAVYGVIPLIMLINVKNFKAVLFWWTFWAIVIGLMYIADPFFGYRWIGGYMPFGFEAMLPAFSGTCIALFHYRKKIVIPLMVVIFIETVVFANKGAIIACAGVFIFSYCFLNEEFSTKRIIFVIVSGCSLLLIRNNILEFFVNLAKKWGVRSYSLITISEVLKSSGNGLFDERTGLWGNVIEYIKQNLILGHGIGYVEWKMGNYAHNFFLDIVATFGVFLSIFIMLFLLYLLKRIKKIENTEWKYFAYLMFVLWFFPLQFSLTFWKVSNFWIFIAIPLLKNCYSKEK